MAKKTRVKATISAIFSGIAGEYLVASQLSQRGIIASVTLKNTRGVDILASNADASKLVGIQVKTRQTGHMKWPILKGNILQSAHLFYVFVHLHLDTGGPPEFFIVPSKAVADMAARTKGFQITDDAYRNKWDSLGLG